MKGRFQGLMAIGAFIVLGGCAAQQTHFEFTKAGGSQEVFSQDNAACVNQADAVQFSDYEYRGTIMEGANIKMKQKKTFYNCMISKGYKDRNA